MKIVSPHFFRKPTVEIAKALIGMNLVRARNGMIQRYRITEVEAYDGPDDRASHASRGKTKRNAPMYASGGIWYVYFVYGMHWMLNIVTGSQEYPAAVLIRGVEGIIGPARLTAHLGITGWWNGKAAHPSNRLWIEQRSQSIEASRIQSSPRIGVEYAGPVWSKKLYRFTLRSLYE